MNKGPSHRENAVSLEKLFVEPPAAPTTLEFPFREARIEALAKRSSRTVPLATASAFAQWVYHLYKPPRPPLPLGIDIKEAKYSDEELHKQMGLFGEKEIEKLRLWANYRFPGSMSGNWKLEFARPREDIADTLEANSSPTIFEASALRIDGQPLRCVPDVVLRHIHSGDIIIIERKVTMVPSDKIPAMGWPNLKAQLWAYSWIDRWLDAPNVYLLGQIWSARAWVQIGWPLSLLKIYPRWKRSDPALQAHCQRLFSLYGGTILGAGGPHA